MYKILNDHCLPIMRTVFPRSFNPYELRYKTPFQGNNIRSVYYGTETVSNRGPKTWALVPDNIKMSTSLSEFKAKIKTWRPEGCTCRLCKIYIYGVGFI